MVCYNFSDLFWCIIRLWNKEGEKTLSLQEEKKEKEFDMRPPEIEPGPTDSESDVQSMHMALTRDQAQRACEWGLHI